MYSRDSSKIELWKKGSDKGYITNSPFVENNAFPGSSDLPQRNHKKSHNIHDKYEWMVLATRDMTHVAVSQLFEEVWN